MNPRTALRRTVPATAALGILLAAALTGCSAPVTPTASPSASDATSSPTPTETTTSSPTPTPVADDCGLTDDTRANVRDALSSANTAALEGYVAPSVYVTYASSEAEGEVTDPALVVSDIGDVSYVGPTWTFDFSAEQLAEWAASPYYAEDFTECAIIGVQSDDRGISLTFDDGMIVRVLITYFVEAWSFD